MLSHYNRPKSLLHYTNLILVALIIAGIGTYLLINSHAATPYASTVADNGSLTSGAVKQTCSGASDGNCVVFGGNSSQFSIKVSGNKFVNQSGQTIQLRGVNRSGTEYSCTDNYPYKFITDTGDGQGEQLAYASTVASSLLKWNKAGATNNAINVVRIPLNEDCWLGINLPSGAAPYIGMNYQNFIQAEVNDLTAEHIYVILDLHLTAPGSILATQQDVAPDEDHAPTFWQQVAEQYKNQPSVMFDLFNEPRLTQGSPWTCYQLGCNYTYSSGDLSSGGGLSGRTGQYASLQVAGTQQLVNVIRAADANNVIFIEGLSYADAFDDWVANAPHDDCTGPNYSPPCSNVDSQIAPELHMYSYSVGNTITEPGDNTSGIDNALAAGGMSSSYPIYMGEFGELMCSGTSGGFTNDAMNWADSHGYSYTAWAWDEGQGCGGPSLVTNNDTGATSPYGAIVEAHLQSLEQ